MPENKKDELPEELQKSLIDIFKSYEREDEEIYKAQKRDWMKNEEFWHGVQYLFWSERDEMWRSPADISWGDNAEDEEIQDQIGSFDDRVINIFRGHGEAIIAALSQQIPSLRFIPDDADDSDDVLTAQTYDKICDLIQRHNKTKLLALRAFFFLYLNGIVASYIYKDSDFKYGSYTIPDYNIEEQDVSVCPECENEFEDESLENPEESNVKNKSGKTRICDNCGEEVKPKEEKKEVPVPTAPKILPKTRVKIDIFGALQIKVRVTARNQDETPYLRLMQDIGKEIAIATYPDKEEDIDKDQLSDYDRFPRTQYTFPTDPEVENRNLITVYKMWMRPESFNKEKDKKKRKELQKRYPKGVRLEVLGKNKVFAKAEEEELDKWWRVGQAGLSTFIHADPICAPIVSIQEMRNILANLTLATIEHGIPATFADPKVVNFDEYSNFEADPGNLYKTLPGKPGQRIGDAFYETSRAMLSAEVPGFNRQLDQDAQFCLGSFPSVVGAPAQRDRSTAKEYELSRQIALQRLQIAWQLFVDWFKTTSENAVHLFVETIVEDEKFVKKDKQGNYVNIWIRQTELNGEVGGCESEADQNFPQSLAQMQTAVFKLMELNNPFINSALYTPENAREIQDVLALPNFKLPGETQRIKQIYEIKELVKSEPIAAGVSLGPDEKPEEIHDSSVPIEPDIDDDAVHAETCRAFLVDMTGIDLKRTNPAGYMNVYYHMKAHLANIAVQTAKAGATAPGQPQPTTQVGPEQ